VFGTSPVRLKSAECGAEIVLASILNSVWAICWTFCWLVGQAVGTAILSCDAIVTLLLYNFVVLYWLLIVVRI
jgi:hypothetical protein